MNLAISFVQEMKGLMGGFIVMSFLYYYWGGTQANGVIHEERLPFVGGDRMIGIVFIILM